MKVNPVTTDEIGIRDLLFSTDCYALPVWTRRAFPEMESTDASGEEQPAAFFNDIIFTAFIDFGLEGYFRRFAFGYEGVHNALNGTSFMCQKHFLAAAGYAVITALGQKVCISAEETTDYWDYLQQINRGLDDLTRCSTVAHEVIALFRGKQGIEFQISNGTSPPMTPDEFVERGQSNFESTPNPQWRIPSIRADYGAFEAAAARVGKNIEILIEEIFQVPPVFFSCDDLSTISSSSSFQFRDHIRMTLPEMIELDGSVPWVYSPNARLRTYVNHISSSPIVGLNRLSAAEFQKFLSECTLGRYTERTCPSIFNECACARIVKSTERFKVSPMSPWKLLATIKYEFATEYWADHGLNLNRPSYLRSIDPIWRSGAVTNPSVPIQTFVGNRAFGKRGWWSGAIQHLTFLESLSQQLKHGKGILFVYNLGHHVRCA